MAHIAIIWLLIGAALIIAEVSMMPGIGLLFAGLGGITTGGLVAFDVLEPESLNYQVASFFVASCIWAALLWVPLKKYRHAHPEAQYKNITGQTATIHKAALTKNKTGQVKWSGTLMKAKLDPAAKPDSIAAGEEVHVVKATGNTLIVKPKQ